MANDLRIDVFDPAASCKPAPYESRANVLKRAFAAGSAIFAGGVLVAGLPRSAASAPSPAQDAEMLTGELLEFSEIVRGHERAHVAFLRDALGRKARKRPSFDFGDATQNPTAFAAAAVALQDLMVAAYNGQAANLTKGALEAAAKIVSVEARHAGWIRAITEKNPAPEPTDTPRTAAQVTAAVNKTKFLKSD
jgi:Ferritin-like domain